MNEQEYVRQLELTIGRLLEPLKGIPFPVAIKALTGYRVLTFHTSVEGNRQLLSRLSKAAQLGAKKAFEDGVFAARPNEAGNHIEPFVVEALRQAGFKADKPVSRSGRIKSTGYPDIQVEDMSGTALYIDCKTYNASTKDTTFRSFFFSPSEDPKITMDAFHLLMSFELVVAERKGKTAFVPVSWQIYTLDKLLVQIKHEFNANNRELYTREALLAEGRIT